MWGFYLDDENSSVHWNTSTHLTNYTAPHSTGTLVLIWQTTCHPNPTEHWYLSDKLHATTFYWDIGTYLTNYMPPHLLGHWYLSDKLHGTTFPKTIILTRKALRICNDRSFIICLLLIRVIKPRKMRRVKNAACIRAMRKAQTFLSKA